MKKNYNDRIMELLTNKMKIDRMQLFWSLFGGYGWFIVVVGIIISLVKGFDVMDWDTERGLYIILGGIFVSWMVGTMIVGLATLIDSTTRTESYIKTLLEYTISQKDSAILSDFEDGVYHRAESDSHNSKKWVCPYCGQINEMWQTTCPKCDYSIDKQTVENDENESK